MSGGPRDMEQMGREAQRILAQMDANDRMRQQLERAERAALAQWRRDVARHADALRRSAAAARPLSLGGRFMAGIFMLMMGFAAFLMLGVLWSILRGVTGL